MTPRCEDVILIACSALEPTAEQQERLISACQRCAVDWDLVYLGAVEHKVAPLVYRNLKRFEPLIGSLSKRVADCFMKTSRQSSLRNLVSASGISNVAAYFHRNGHNILLLKHISYFLTHKALFDATMSDDVDLVARPSAEATDLAQTPYLWSIYNTTDATWKVIDGLIASNDPFLQHMHFEVDNRLHHDVVWNGVIPIDFRKIWRDAEVYEIQGMPIYAPEMHDLIIISAVNIFRKQFIRLRNIVEIHELIRLKKPDWAALSEKAHSYQCASLVYSALTVTRSILGSDFHDTDLKALRPGAFRSRAIAVMNRQMSATAVCRETSFHDHIYRSQQRALNFVRRLLALDVRQVMRFVWLRIFLRRIVRVVKH